MFEFLKLMVSLLFGGVAGALLNEWFRRKSAKVQAIPLIERVNRLVSPKLKGYTLARMSSDGEQLEPITNVREYQFTLRNTSTVHLQDAEIQFEFPSEDVEAYAERPALSKTSLVPVDPVIAKPWKKGYRWCIPQFPSTDSIDFTFRAVSPTSENYEVALYKSDRVVIEKSKGDPSARISLIQTRYLVERIVLPLVAVVLASNALLLVLHDRAGSDKLNQIKSDGCSLTILSSYKQVNNSVLFWRGPFHTDFKILNTGREKCTLQIASFPGAPLQIMPGEQLSRTLYTQELPQLVLSTATVGTDTPRQNFQVSLYGAKE